MPRALIVGGGIGGLAAGIALRQSGWDVQVFERAPDIREVGAGLMLWTNAVKVLRKLGVGPAVEAASSPLRESEVRSWRGKFLMSTDLGVIGEKLGAPNLGVHRSALQAILADALGRDRIHLGRECVGYSQDAAHATAHFADGRDETGDVLIGADGIKSAVRRQLRGDEPLRYAGYAAWRGVGRIDCPEVPHGLNLFLTGRGAQAGILPIGREQTYWFATVNAPMGLSDPPTGHKGPLLDRFGDWFAPLPAAIAATPETGILRNDIFDRSPVRKWSDGRVTLLGDAAHATTPNLGQGACQAIESGWVLARHLASSDGVADRLTAYERSRFDRTAQVTNRSWSMGKLLVLESPVLCGLRDFAMSAFRSRAERDVEKLIGVEV